MIAVEVESTDGQLKVGLAGELDADNAPTLLQRLTAAHQGSVDLVIDIQGLEFIDSSGISAFLRVREMVIESGGVFAVIGPRPAVRRVFEIAGLLEVFGLA